MIIVCTSRGYLHTCILLFVKKLEGGGGGEGGRMGNPSYAPHVLSEPVHCVVI